MSGLLTYPNARSLKRRYSSRPFYWTLLSLTILATLNWGFGALHDVFITSPPRHSGLQTRADTSVLGQGGIEQEVLSQKSFQFIVDILRHCLCLLVLLH